MSSPIESTAPQIWEATLGQLLLRVTRQNYDTWLRNTEGLRFEGTTLVVVAPNELACDWLSTRMRSVIAQALTAVAGAGLKVRFEPAEAGGSRDGEGRSLQPSMLPELSTPLNPRFRFSTFLEAGFNRMALTAARDIASETSSTYSPLFITGPGGSGKTHLLHAIAHAAASTRRTRYLLVSAEQFLSEFTTAVRNKNGAAFRARYRELDLLLVDDVHLLLGKKGTLNEFHQTVAGLHDQGRRIAVAGDSSALSAQSARFRGQLNWGLVACIEQPSTEDRVRFVQAKAELQGVPLPDEVQHYLALRVRSSVRDLEGAVNRVTALARISKEPITIDFAARALQPVSSTSAEQSQTIAPINLIETVCRYLDVSPGDVTGPKRDRALTYARHVAMYLLRHDAQLTYAAIAQLMGKKDHSTVVHAVGQLHKQLPVSPSLRADIDAVRASIHTSHPAA